AYLTAAAFSMATLIGAAARGLVPSARRTAFGARQLTVAALGVLLVLGFAGQAIGMIPGNWGVGERRLAPAWAVVATDPDAPFRVLWLGPENGEPLPPPAGDPDGVLRAGGVSLAYGVTGPGGRSVLRLGTPAQGSAFDSLEDALAAVVSGRVRHGGSALAPFGIRYVVAAPSTLDPGVAQTLSQQVDVDLVQAEGGLVLYRSAVSLPPAAILSGEAATVAAERSDPLATASIPVGGKTPLERLGHGWGGASPEAGLALITDEFDAGWSADQAGGDIQPVAAFGWALGFEVGAGEIRMEPDGLPWTLQLAGLAVLWAGALWVVRRPPEEAASRKRSSRTAGMSQEATPA
ncbi:MAG: hypothetical protein ACRDH9_07525, partial [Actinomycetota bacterium]